jgi:hypothetical protein
MIARVALALVVMCGVASAGKPSAKAAKAAVAAWTKALGKVSADKPAWTEIAALTGDNFRAVVSFQQPDRVCDKTIADRAKLAEALACVRDSSAVMRAFKPWKKSDRDKLSTPLDDFADEVEALAKTHQLFIRYEEGEGMWTVAIIGVSLGADKKPHVSAVFAGEYYN